MLKRIISVSATCVMCLALAATSFAARDVKTGPGKTEAPKAPAAAVTPETKKDDDTIIIEGINHTVVAGDTLGHLSVNYFGNYNYHGALYEINADILEKTKGVLTVGMEVFIPDVIYDTNRLDLPVAGKDEVLYVVKGGETLGSIAAEQYDDISFCNAIFQRNKDRLPTINTLYEGQIIVLPVVEVIEATGAPVVEQPTFEG
ncbi:MAG: LysM peptidoglycan-binding domain-containing protein [Oscillospiraceae bacterium]